MTGPAIAVGLPVYNGARYLRAMIESILKQDWVDFEFIISDNASTDSTPAICREYAARDPRIRYHRRIRNDGAAVNYNTVFALAQATFFIWVSHDDLYEPSYLRACMEALQANPTAVVAYTTAILINEYGARVGEFRESVDVRHGCPVERMQRLLADRHSWCHATIGLTRTHILAQTQLVGAYPRSDHVLMAELALRGDLLQLSKPLFLRRVHDGESPSLKANPTPEGLARWYDTRGDNRLSMPQARLLIEHMRAVRRAPLTNRQRWACYRLLFTTPAASNWSSRVLWREWTRAVRKAAWEGPTVNMVCRTRRHYLPHRLWAFLSGLRRVDLGPILLAISPPGPTTHAALLEFVAHRLGRRRDRDARVLLQAWRSGSHEAQRQAAARVLDGGSLST